MTTAFDVKDALVAALKTAPGLTDLADDAIWYGYEGGAGKRPRECVWVGEIGWEDDEGAAFGYSRKDETYKVMLTVESHFPGDDQVTANGRVKTRVAAIETLLRNPRSLGVPNVFECTVIPQMLGEGTDPDGRGAIFVLAVRVRARF